MRSCSRMSRNNNNNDNDNDIESQIRSIPVKDLLYKDEDGNTLIHDIAANEAEIDNDRLTHIVSLVMGKLSPHININSMKNNHGNSPCDVARQNNIKCLLRCASCTTKRGGARTRKQKCARARGSRRR